MYYIIATSQQTEVGKMEAVTHFLFLGSRIPADGDCRRDIRRRLPLGRKAMTNLDSVLRSKDITLWTKVHIFKAMVIPVVMYGCESGTIKKAEYRRTDTFELWCWKRPLRVPWTAKRSNQSIVKKINPEYSLEGLTEDEATIFGLPDVNSSMEKALMPGKTEGRRKG